LKRIAPDLGISNQTMFILNSFINEVMNRICTEASRLVKNGRGTLLSAREMQTATRLVLSGQLACNAVEEGAQAVASFEQSEIDKARKKEEKKNRREEEKKQPNSKPKLDSPQRSTSKFNTFGSHLATVVESTESEEEKESDDLHSSVASSEEDSHHKT